MKQKRRKTKKTKRRMSPWTIVLSVCAAMLVGVALAAIPGQDVAVEVVADDTQEDEQARMPDPSPPRGISPLTGLPCPAEGQESFDEAQDEPFDEAQDEPFDEAQDEPFDGAQDKPHRPIGIMLAGDEGTRPLSGVGDAGLVVEMPVVTWGINRFMAVFACGGEFEIGSIRSSRDDYIPLAEGFGAIYGHWGGSYLALNQLNRGIMDNVDALRNPYGAYFRKSGILAPDNGFTTLSRMRSAAEQLGYRTEAPEGDLFLRSTTPPETEQKADTVEIGYFGPYRVSWEYDAEAERYYRFRGSREETDANTEEQVDAATVVTLRARVVQRYGQYNDVTIAGGSGEAVVYTFGRMQEGIWKKGEELAAPLEILDAEGKPIPFAPGPVWISVIQTDTPVTVSSADETETQNPKP